MQNLSQLWNFLKSNPIHSVPKLIAWNEHGDKSYILNCDGSVNAIAIGYGYVCAEMMNPEM